jgi:hypothetical protein
MKAKCLFNLFFFIKRANINISVPGVILFALISIPHSSLTCLNHWSERGPGLIPAGCTSQLASI